MKGKVALITGSATGLGKMTALSLARQGCHIAVNYVNSQAQAESLCREIQKFGVSSISVQADITDEQQLYSLVDTTEQQLGTVDILVNNAGPYIHERRLFADYSRDEIVRLVNGNLTGVMLLDHRVLPAMREKKWGRIIHFGFGHAVEARAWPHRAVYAAAKVGLVSFTKTLAIEEAPHGITVNMVCPGDIRGANKEKTIEEVTGVDDGLTPRGRSGSGEDVARVIEFLCQDRSDFLTGNMINVSGGLDPIRSRIKPE
ncbi:MULTISPECIES: SDR family oxidoreductase [Paenibacillus]|uniref:3-oxoacyl-ACP reductase n=1 Tax=Paenibacillus campinasensis TaxID=66347 RepID=A0A268EXU9_9BACL|nr:MULTISPECIES: SDR family oxidoreductase [Paenibacillus]MUG66478.1 SDR family oxidoreductase [Paenibacillus campinasensis]PAD77946.1 3-oxoacyl-ACP reductase [Paenibacillus campinasensis]PAK52972.1 3-oxoacyl-ACP reductase [Paenibacillus sp. 7541]